MASALEAACVAAEPRSADQEAPEAFNMASGPASDAGDSQASSESSAAAGAMALLGGERDEAFYMFHFKVVPCTNTEAHEPEDCPFAHPGEKATRRDPRAFTYTGVSCPLYRKGSCKDGEACRYAHGVFEVWLHPSRFRTELCKDGPACTRKCCFFAHTPEQLREPTPDPPGLQLPTKGSSSSSASSGSGSSSRGGTPAAAAPTTDGESSDGSVSSGSACSASQQCKRAASAPVGGLPTIPRPPIIPPLVGGAAAAATARRASCLLLPPAGAGPLSMASPTRMHGSSSAGQLVGLGGLVPPSPGIMHPAAGHPAAAAAALASSWGSSSLAPAGSLGSGSTQALLMSPLAGGGLHGGPHLGCHSPAPPHPQAAAGLAATGMLAAVGGAGLASPITTVGSPHVHGLAAAAVAAAASGCGAGPPPAITNNHRMLQVPPHVALEAAMVAAAGGPAAAAASLQQVGGGGWGGMAAASPTTPPLAIGGGAAAAAALAAAHGSPPLGVHAADAASLVAAAAAAGLAVPAPPLPAAAAGGAAGIALAAASAHDLLGAQHHELVQTMLLQQALLADEQQQQHAAAAALSADGKQQQLVAMWTAAFTAARNVGLSEVDAAACADCALQQQHGAAAAAAAAQGLLATGTCQPGGAGSPVVGPAAAMLHHQAPGVLAAGPTLTHGALAAHDQLHLSALQQQLLLLQQQQQVALGAAALSAGLHQPPNEFHHPHHALLAAGSPVVVGADKLASSHGDPMMCGLSHTFGLLGV